MPKIVQRDFPDGTSGKSKRQHKCIHCDQFKFLEHFNYEYNRKLNEVVYSNECVVCLRNQKDEAYNELETPEIKKSFLTVKYNKDNKDIYTRRFNAYNKFDNDHIRGLMAKHKITDQQGLFNYESCLDIQCEIIRTLMSKYFYVEKIDDVGNVTKHFSPYNRLITIFHKQFGKTISHLCGIFLDVFEYKNSWMIVCLHEENRKKLMAEFRSFIGNSPQASKVFDLDYIPKEKRKIYAKSLRFNGNTISFPNFTKEDFKQMDKDNVGTTEEEIFDYLKGKNKITTVYFVLKTSTWSLSVNNTYIDEGHDIPDSVGNVIDVNTSDKPDGFFCISGNTVNQYQKGSIDKLSWFASKQESENVKIMKWDAERSVKEGRKNHNREWLDHLEKEVYKNDPATFISLTKCIYPPLDLITDKNYNRFFTDEIITNGLLYEDSKIYFDNMLKAEIQNRLPYAISFDVAGTGEDHSVISIRTGVKGNRCFVYKKYLNTKEMKTLKDCHQDHSIIDVAFKYITIIINNLGYRPISILVDSTACGGQAFYTSFISRYSKIGINVVSCDFSTNPTKFKNYPVSLKDLNTEKVNNLRTYMFFRMKDYFLYQDGKILDVGNGIIKRQLSIISYSEEDNYFKSKPKNKLRREDGIRDLGEIDSYAMLMLLSEENFTNENNSVKMFNTVTRDIF